jgi:hypothetical protein
MTARLPWEIVETLPSTDKTLVAHWGQQVAQAKGSQQRVHALVGRALSLYWAVSEGVSALSWPEVHTLRQNDIHEATRLARSTEDPDLIATALLGELYALWDADGPLKRGPVVAELAELSPRVVDEELRFRIREWKVLAHFDASDLVAAREEMKVFSEEAFRTDLMLFRRRAELWTATVAMLEGRIDEAIQINQHAISSTADLAGSPFSFQNVAINLAIEQFFHRTLGDAIDSIRSIRASSPRVASAWDTGLAFALSECDQLDEATELYDSLAADNFKRVDRDLNWLVTIQLLGLVAVRLEDPVRCQNVLTLMQPFGELDTTHGAGYASYGPIARVLGSLAAVAGDHETAESWFAFVLQNRPAGPWRSLALLNRAQARASLRPEQAIEDADAATTELETFGLTAWAEVARELHQNLQLQGHGTPAARCQENLWTLSHPAGKAVVRHSKGMGYLMQLLARPGDALDVTQLDTEISATMPTDSAATSSIDAEAKESYRRRAATLQAGSELSSRESDELEHLLKELAGSKYVGSSSAELERVRVRVTKAIRRSIHLIGDQAPGLGMHLETSVVTGRRCLYSPAQGTAWEIHRN